MAVLDGLAPERVFGFFEELCAIPHGSGNTRAISAHLAAFARDRGLRHIRDAAGNVLIFQPGTPGREGLEPVILQGHMDMVCEKTADCPLDLTKDGLRLAVEGDMVYAEGTTLGGDDGIAVAMMLALLDDPTLPHPPLECVFTVDEEIGMLGAAALDVSPLLGRRLLNIDSEAEGVFTASCSGGRVVTAELPLRRAPWQGQAQLLRVEGLTGGHSGVEIDRGRANAVQLLGRLLYVMDRRAPLRLALARGGGKDNAIPVRAEALLLSADPEAHAAVCEAMGAALREEFAATDPGLRVTLEAAENPGLPLDADSSRRLLTALLCMPGGVQAMSPYIPGLVQTSLNLGILETGEDAAQAVFCVRSALESGKEMLTDRIAALAETLGGRVSVSGDYPGWAYRPESPLRSLLTEVYREQYGAEPHIAAIHAGLECGLFAGKLPGLDCVSIGPDLTEIHTPRERMHIASIQRTWALLTETLKRMQ
ncbi:MAG: aminoacyl-histidine dipeptidase [Oscillospiraceae bacterium]|nr:aminoacyl-histidine dipeptidase [Oscillospiraceae bacterium]